jgi:hypothetical protein
MESRHVCSFNNLQPERRHLYLRTHVSETAGHHIAFEVQALERGGTANISSSLDCWKSRQDMAITARSVGKTGAFKTRGRKHIGSQRQILETATRKKHGTSSAEFLENSREV